MDENEKAESRLLEAMEGRPLWWVLGHVVDLVRYYRCESVAGKIKLHTLADIVAFVGKQVEEFQ